MIRPYWKVPSRLSNVSLALVCVLLGGEAVAQQTAPDVDPHTGSIIEQGKFILHKFAQPIGEESYQIRKEGRSSELKSSFEFTDRGGAVPLTATLKFESNLTPEQFQVKGKNSRFNPIDDLVSVVGGTVHVRQGQSERVEPRPRQFFAISGYAPVAMQMMLLRYWHEHGSPHRLRTFPTGEVNIEHRGSDLIEIESKPISLERYIITGLIWGREAIWLDSKRQLIAVIGVDAEFDHFEALREGYETALPVLLASSAKDEMAVLADIAKTFPGRRTGKLAFVGGTLVDGTGHEPISDATVVTFGDRIVSAGPRAEVAVPADATLIDTTGKTILPGLWDMHAHFEQVEWGPIYLAAGVTTVRDCGNEFEFIVAARDAIRSGRGLGPRLLLAGIVDGTGPKALGVQRVDSPAEAQAWVNRYHDAGFQQMKIYSSMTRENVQAVATAAHQLGMTVTGHVPIGMNLFQAVDAGMDQINHVHYVAESMIPDGIPENSSRDQILQRFAAIDVHSPQAIKVIDLLKAHSIVVDPTVALEEQGTASPSRPLDTLEPGVLKVASELAAQFVTPTDVDPMQQARLASLQRSLEIIGALHAAGVPIVAGTDQAVPGYSLYREIELYVEAGFTPMEAIRAATIVPARVMRLDGELGTVEPGKKADLIVLGANPLEFIHNIRSVEKVVSGGTLYDSAPLWKSVGFKP
jgi:imidazolonepropionase-like amidohydrolase